MGSPGASFAVRGRGGIQVPKADAILSRDSIGSTISKWLAVFGAFPRS
jgi:hypothetical protein